MLPETQRILGVGEEVEWQEIRDLEINPLLQHTVELHHSRFP